MCDNSLLVAQQDISLVGGGSMELQFCRNFRGDSAEGIYSGSNAKRREKTHAG